MKLYDGGKTAPIPVRYESMVPKAIKDVFHNWVSEVMNQGVHVHSKVIVIDPFGKNPVVITGSHNLGYKASTKNDDNMMIVEDNAPLAASYAANIIAIYQTYRWNTYVDAHAKDPQVWHGLVDNATWQDSYLKAGGPDLAEIKFWLGEGPSAQRRPWRRQRRAARKCGPRPQADQRRARGARPAAGKKPVKKPLRAKGAPVKKAPAKSRRVAAKKASTKKTANPKATARSKRAGARSAASNEGGASEASAGENEARACEKGAPEVQNSADEIDESRSRAESHPEDRFEDAAARQVKARATAREALGARSARRIPVRRLRLRAVDDHELVGEHAVRGALVAVGPLHPDFRALGRAKADMDEARMAGGVAAADVDETRLAAGSRPDRNPRPDGVAIGVRLDEADLGSSYPSAAADRRRSWRPDCARAERSSRD